MNNHCQLKDDFDLSINIIIYIKGCKNMKYCF